VSELPFVRERPAGSVAPPLSLAQLRAFDAVIDARSPSEYAEDHLPGAISCPTLDDEERALVGTIYKEQGAFEAKRVGAPLARATSRATSSALRRQAARLAAAGLLLARRRALGLARARAAPGRLGCARLGRRLQGVPAPGRRRPRGAAASASTST
jgi:rhodanese-related sulfurtransferase